MSQVSDIGYMNRTSFVLIVTGVVENASDPAKVHQAVDYFKRE